MRDMFHSEDDADETTELLKPKYTARLLQLSEKGLWNITTPRGQLPCVKVGKSVRYSKRDLNNFIESQTVKAVK